MMKNVLPHECISTSMYYYIKNKPIRHCKNVYCNSEHVLTLFCCLLPHMVSAIKSQGSRAIQTQSKECT